MFTDLFNCPNCKRPYDFKEDEPRTPVYYVGYHIFRCSKCAGNVTFHLRGLMEFLDQPAFTKTENGYEYNAPFNDPICYGCLGTVKVKEGISAVPVFCGHYLCEGCIVKRRAGTVFTCNKCNFKADVTASHLPADLTLVAFSQQARQFELQTFKARIDEIEAKKEADRKNGALKDCGHCGAEQSVDRLLKCDDCMTTICGVCSFDSHREHSVEKLLGTELAQLEKENNKKCTDILGGLHGNLKYIHTTIDDAVGKVMSAGKDRLSKVPKCGKHEDAQKIVTKVDKATVEFEKHCEEYIPVARNLATRLTELGEKLANDEE